MIEIHKVTKTFGDTTAVQDLSTHIADGQIFGLVGTNGAGKSTLMRLIAGVLKADSGDILLDGQRIYENPEAKGEICYVSDEGFFMPGATPRTMGEYFSCFFPAFDMEKYRHLTESIGLDENRAVAAFSKGMKKQVSILLGVAAGTRYLLLDETFDGLDPVVRQAVKGLFATEMLDRDFTPVVSSHNMRELEDICDHVGLLYKGRILFSENLEDMKFHLQKVQCVIRDPEKEAALLEALTVVKKEKQGSLLSVVARGTRAEIMDQVRKAQPVFAETLPLTLEEIFISETEVAGYEIRNLFM